MSSHRVLVEPGALVAGATVDLDDQAVHHLRVRRAEPGQDATVFDGAGVTAAGVLARAGKAWQVAVEAVELHPAATVLILAVGAGDRDRFLALAEKCTELGVSRLIPLLTERSVQVETRLREAGIERARWRAREACKQSGNPWATLVDDLTPIDGIIGRFPGVRWLLADPHGAPPESTSTAAPIGWCIGPEGGFAEGEVTAIRAQMAAVPVRLGGHVMRFETAAVVAAGVTRT